MRGPPAVHYHSLRSSLFSLGLLFWVNVCSPARLGALGGKRRDQAIFKTVFQTGPGSINIYSNDNCMSSLPGSVFSLDLVVFFFLIVLGTLLVGDCGLGKGRLGWTGPEPILWSCSVSRATNSSIRKVPRTRRSWITSSTSDHHVFSLPQINHLALMGYCFECMDSEVSLLVGIIYYLWAMWLL